MSDLQHVDIKVYADQCDGVAATEFVAVLQRWIQEDTIAGVLIDVADYSHIQDGAGIILVGHQFNVSIDYVDGRMGLLVHYKFTPGDTLEARIGAAAQLAFEAAAILQDEPEFQGRLSFARDGFRFMASDRLRAPNDDVSYDAVAQAVEAAAKSLSGGDATLTRVNDDARDRLTVDVTTSVAVPSGVQA